MPAVDRQRLAAVTGTAHDYPDVMSDVSPSQAFADLIRTAREARGWNQEQLSKATASDDGEHVSVSTISRWERGQAGRPEPLHVRKVCRALNVDPRRAAVALGYLAPEEIEPPSIDPAVRDILTMLEDPGLDPAAREEWIKYLKFLYDNRRVRQAS